MSHLLDETVVCEIAATPNQCLAILLDYEKYPRWQKTVRHVRVLERVGNAVTVEFTIGIFIGSFNYVIRYTEDPAQMQLRYDFIAGEMKNLFGDMRLFPVGDGHCEIHYRIAVDPGFWVPQALVNIGKNTSMRGVLKDLQKHVERLKSARQPLPELA